MHVDTLDREYRRMITSMLNAAAAIDRHPANVVALLERIADAEGDITLSPLEATIAGAAIGVVRSLQMTRNRIAELRGELN